MRLRSVELEVPDTSAAAAFMQDVWGLSPAGTRSRTTYLRGTGDHPYLLALAKASAPAIATVTFSGSAGEIDALHARVVAAGVPAPARVAEFDDPGGGGGFVVRGAEAQAFRFVAEVTRAEPLGDRLRPIQLTHVVLNALDRDACAKFVIDALGFKLADRTRHMTFVRCNSAHHALAFAHAEVPALNHIAFEMTDIDAVMKNIGRLRDLGMTPAWGPGRHGPGNNVFAYFITPFGASMEYTAEVQRVDDSYRVGTPEDWKWPPNRIDHWGVSTRDNARLGEAERTFRFRQGGTA
jgi:catechol 2,3-dioxygenase-like lactoylglutathione lyase family enzyme